MTDTKKNILVTGGLGFIGSHTVVALIEAGYIPVIVDSLENSELFILNRIEQITGVKPVFYQTDCRDEKAMEKIFTAHTIHGVIHFAAYKSVDESVKKPIKYFENNLGSLSVILKTMHAAGVNQLVFSSSCTVYGNTTHVPVGEETPLGEAWSPYGYTKQVGETMIQYFTAANTSFRSVLLRYFNPIGAHPSGYIGELPKGVPGNLVPFMTQTAAGIRKELTVFGNDYNTSDGTCVRDYIHVCDLARAHVLALQRQPMFASHCEIINLGTGKGNTVLEVIHTFEKVSGTKLNYTIGKRREGDIPEMYASVKRAGELLQWSPQFTLHDALTHAWKWQQGLKEK